jgi:hypothetical protein
MSGAADDDERQVRRRKEREGLCEFKKVWGLALATAAVAIASATTARADERIIAKVPFAFVVHDTRLPAGEYMLKTVQTIRPSG